MSYEKYAYGNDKPIDTSQIELGDVVAFIGEYGRGVAAMCEVETEEDDSERVYTMCSYNLENPNGLSPEGPIPCHVPLLQPTKDDLILAIDTLETDNQDALKTFENPKTFMLPYFCMGVLRAARRNVTEQITKAIDDYNEIQQHLMQRWNKTLDRQHYDILIEQKKLKEEIKKQKKHIAELKKMLKSKDTCVKKTETILPDVLKSESANKIKASLFQAGIIDDNWQPVGLSGPERGVLASEISKRLEIKNLWQVFGELWGEKRDTLRKNQSKGMDQSKTTAFLNKLKSILN